MTLSEIFDEDSQKRNLQRRAFDANRQKQLLKLANAKFNMLKAQKQYQQAVKAFTQTQQQKGR